MFGTPHCILWYGIFELLNVCYGVKGKAFWTESSRKLTSPLISILILQCSFANLWPSSWLGHFFTNVGGLNVIKISMCSWNFSGYDKQKKSSCHAQSQRLMHLKVIVSFGGGIVFRRSVHVLNHFRPPPYQNWSSKFTMTHVFIYFRWKMQSQETNILQWPVGDLTTHTCKGSLTILTDQAKAIHQTPSQQPLTLSNGKGDHIKLKWYILTVLWLCSDRAQNQSPNMVKHLQGLRVRRNGSMVLLWWFFSSHVASTMRKWQHDKATDPTPKDSKQVAYLPMRPTQSLTCSLSKCWSRIIFTKVIGMLGLAIVESTQDWL